MSVSHVEQLVRWRRRASRLLTRYRRPLAASLLALALVLAASALRPEGVPQRRVVVAAHDLAAGAIVVSSDLDVASLPTSSTPAGVTNNQELVIGRQLAGAVRRGEPLTDVRFVDSGALADVAGSGRVAVPVRLSDGEVATLLTPGGVVDVIAADGRGAAQVVASAARVLAVPGADGDFFDGALVVVSATPTEAEALAAAAAVGPLSVTLRG
jgi:Flp pilus assembly protein CpaB